MSYSRVLRPKNEGVADVTDIIETIKNRRPRYMRNSTIVMSAAEFAALPRDPDGNLIGINGSGRFWQRFSFEQMSSVSQKDKDDMRFALNMMV